MSSIDNYYDQMKKNFEEPVDHESLLISELISEVEEFYQSYMQRGCLYPNRNIFTKISDDSFGGFDRFQASIQLQFKRSIPPAHTFVIETSKNYNVENILFSYEYSYGFIADFIVKKSELTSKLLSLFRTVFWIDRCRNEYSILKEKKLSKYRYAGQLKYWSDLFLISEFENKSYTEQIENWVDKNLTPDQKIEQSRLYETYWEGIPEQNRYFITANF